MARRHSRHDLGGTSGIAVHRAASRLGLLALAVVVMAGCGKSADESPFLPDPMPPSPRVSFLLPDLSTMVSPSALAAGVGFLDQRTHDAAIAELRDRIRISPADGGAPVPRHLVITRDSGDEIDLQIVPDGPLGDGWYVLSLAPAASGANPIFDAGRTWPVRFSTGSHPTLISISAYGKDAGWVRVTMVASENVDVALHPDDLIIAQGDHHMERWKYESYTVITYPDGGTETKTTPLPPYYASSVWDCYGCRLGGVWHFALRPGIVSESGKPLSTYDGVTHFDVAFDASHADLRGGYWTWSGEQARSMPPWRPVTRRCVTIDGRRSCAPVPDAQGGQ